MVDFENSQVIDSTPLGFLSAENHLGQTFIVRRTPLTAVKLHLRLGEESPDLDSQVILSLYDSPDRQLSVYRGQVSYRQIQNNFPILISVPQLDREPGQILFMELEASGSPVWVYGRGEDNYPDGQFYSNGQPQAGDLAFSLSYRYGLQAVGQDLLAIFQKSWLVIPLVALLIAPGYVVLSTSGPNRSYRLPEQIGFALGISLALPALVMTWTSLLGLALPVWLVTAAYSLLVIAAIGIAIYRLFQSRRMAPPSTGQAEGRPRFSPPALIVVALGLLFLLALFVRLAMVRDLSGPAWVDPVHHSLITRLIQNAGRIPSDFTPYAQASATNYHTGFHVSAAVFGWLAKLEAIDSLFIVGQFLNAAALFAVYLLGYELTGSRLAGFLAALVASFASPMPAYYTSWGRYTQLAGLVVLPTGFVLLRQAYRPVIADAVEQASSRWPGTAGRWWIPLLAAAVCAGLFFIHYRVAAFLLCLVAADVFVLFISRIRSPDPGWRLDIRALLISTALTILFSMPVLIPVVFDLLPRLAVQWNQPGSVEAFSIAWGFLTAGLGRPMLYAACLGLLLAVVRNWRLALTTVLWVGLMFLAANLNRLGLPAGGFISNDSVVISLFLPLSILAAYPFVELWQFARRRGTTMSLAVGLPIVILATYTILVGSQRLLPIINSATVFLRSGDRNAAHWIEDNLPEEAGLLINPSLWGYGIYVGSDGGYWLSPLTGRQTFPPTLLYGHGLRADIAVINQSTSSVMENAQDPTFLASFMRDNLLEYVYLGVRGGPISALELLQSAEFEVIYHQDGAWIFRLVNPAAP